MEEMVGLGADEMELKMKYISRTREIYGCEHIPKTSLRNSIVESNGFISMSAILPK